MSTRSSPSEYIQSDDGRSPPPDESSSDEGAVSAEDERESTRDKPPQGRAAKRRKPNASQQKQTSKTISKGRKPSKLQGYLTIAYRNLLNATILDVAKRVVPAPDPLLGSLIAASFWTLSEKDRFFGQLERSRPDNTLVLSKAIGTKSEAEVQAYLDLLRKGALETPADFGPEEIPAAFEVGTKCEEMVAFAAEALARHVEDHDVELEAQKYGDSWLIDEGTASEIEERFELRHEAPTDSGDTSREEQTASRPSADELLRPAMLLKLSRTFFMNPQLGTESNWRELVEHDCVSSCPAMFRSAFVDLHTIVVSITKQLVQATLFQANSRLRAKENRHPIVAVKADDVRAAADLLNYQPDWHQYWAKVAARCGLEVYTWSEKYADGRKGEKNGIKLTSKEVEAALDTNSKPSSNLPKADIPAIKTGEHQAPLEEELQRTDDDKKSQSTADGLSLTDQSDGDEPAVRLGLLPTSIRAQESQEDHYLESVDQIENRAEEERLLNIMGIHDQIPNPVAIDVVPQAQRSKRPRRASRSRSAKRAKTELSKKRLARVDAGASLTPSDGAAASPRSTGEDGASGE